MKLWVDDVRMPPDGTWMHVETSEEALIALQRWSIAEMSLDHDLGGEDTSRRVVTWLCYNPEFWPPVVHVHSANPVGVAWLRGMIERYNVNALS